MRHGHIGIVEHSDRWLRSYHRAAGSAGKPGEAGEIAEIEHLSVEGDDKEEKNEGFGGIAVFLYL